MRLVNLDGTPVGVGGEWVNGILMRVAPASSEYNLEIQRADITGSTISASSQLSDSQFVSIATLPPDQVNMAGTLYVDTPSAKRDTAYWYRFRHTRADVTESQWLTDDNSHTPQNISLAAINTFGTTQAAFAGKTTDVEGSTLDRFVGQYDGVSNLTLTVGTQTGFVSHSEAVTFSPAFVGSPTVVFQGGFSQQTESLWGTEAQVNAGTAASLPTPNTAQYDIYSADNLSSTGFTARLLLNQVPTYTARHDTIQTTSPQGTGGSVYYLIDGYQQANKTFISGSAVSCSVANASTCENGQYVARFIASSKIIQSPSRPGWSLMGNAWVVDTNNGSGWVQRSSFVGQYVFGVNGTLNEDYTEMSIPFTDTSLSNGDLVRVRLSTVNALPNTYIQVWPQGLTLDYFTNAPAQYAKKTDISTQVSWTAYGLQ